MMSEKPPMRMVLLSPFICPSMTAAPRTSGTRCRPTNMRNTAVAVLLAIAVAASASAETIAFHVRLTDGRTALLAKKGQSQTVAFDSDVHVAF